jgi:DNA polymerase (family 10)
LKKLVTVTGSVSSLKVNGSFPSERSFYDKFGMAFIDPELREGLDEVPRARRGTLPTLVTQTDIEGDLHTHTEASDGSNSIEQMAAAAKEIGYAYIGISDHSQSLKIAGGVSEERLWAQIRRIDQLNENLAGIRILKSAEVDILADGALDYPDDLLRELDYTVCSIHSRFAFGREKQTERILRAMDNRFFTMGHATGRLLLKRPGYEIDMERIALHARQSGCFFEINSSPDRLDLSAENARLAVALGVLIAISTDAHSIHEFGTIRYGIEQARRAGLEKTSVLNCQPLERLATLFRR